MSDRWTYFFLAPVFLFSALAVAQVGGENGPPAAANGPAADGEDLFDDLYPDADLPDAAVPSGTRERPPRESAGRGAPPAPEEAPQPPVADQGSDPGATPGGESPATPEPAAEVDFGDLYPDVELPGVKQPKPRPGDDRREGVPPRGDSGGDPFADLYPDVTLPGSDGSGAPDDDAGSSPPGGRDAIDLSPPGERRPGDMQDRDAALIEELFGDAAAQRRSEAEEEVDVVHSPRELLAVFDPPIDESQLRSFVDGQPLSGADEETLTRILYRLPSFSLEQIQRWEHADPNWEQLVEEPDLFRVEIFRAWGRVRKIARVGVIPEIAERLQFEHYYRVTIDLADSPYRAIVCTQNIPNAWIRAQKENRELNERAGFSGLFLKVGAEQEGKTELVFAARRVAWYPDREDASRGVTGGDVLLGNLQMDVGLLELVKDRTPIGPSDREGFYQLLSALGHTTLKKLDQQAAQTHDIAAMLLRPDTQRGKLMSIRGNARRILEIRVDDPDIRERFGITHYYELAVFVPLEKRIEISVGEGEPPKRFDSSYPMIFCVRNLPEGMPSGSDIREPVTVRIPAYYFKLYSYRSQYMSSGSQGVRQLSPLLIGLEPEWIVPEQQTNPWLSILLGALFIVAVAGTWIGLWRYSRSDRQFERDTLARQFELAEGKSLNEMGIEASSGPDFSGLESASPAPKSPPETEQRATDS
jgi:hypothetical protein